MNILLIGHACSPGLGSEPGFTWNWAQQLSVTHGVWVVTHPQYRSRVEAFLETNPNPNLRFVWVSVQSIFDRWDPARGEKGIRIHYLLWLRQAYQVAQKLCREVNFDLAHHVSWGTLGAPPPLWRLPVPSVWGPLGGGQRAPLPFLGYFGWRAVPELARSLYVRLLRFSPGVRKAARSAGMILTTNRETAELLEPMAGGKVRMFLDSGLQADWVPQTCPSARSSEELTLLWAGRIESRKALALGLHALAKARRVPSRLMIAGEGPLRPQLEALAAELGLCKRVTFLGTVPYTGMQSLFQTADAFLFTSLRDSFGSVVLEAMAQGLPIIALDHHGVGTFVPNEAGIKVPVRNPRQTVEDLASAIEALGLSPASRRGMELAAWKFAQDQTWQRRGERMKKLYEELTFAKGKHEAVRSAESEISSAAACGKCSS